MLDLAPPGAEAQLGGLGLGLGDRGGGAAAPVDVAHAAAWTPTRVGPVDLDEEVRLRAPPLGVGQRRRLGLRTSQRGGNECTTTQRYEASVAHLASADVPAAPRLSLEHSVIMARLPSVVTTQRGADLPDGRPSRRAPEQSGPWCTAQDRADAIRIALSGIAAGDDPFYLVSQLEPLRPKKAFPAEVLLELAADALELSGASRENPVDYELTRERYLPEFELCAKTQHRRATTRWGRRRSSEPASARLSFEEVSWWHNNDRFVWSLYALVIYASQWSARASPGVQPRFRARAGDRPPRRDSPPALTVTG